MFIVFLFPPVIMHTVYLEAESEGSTPPPPIYRGLLAAMSLVSPLVGVLLMLAISMSCHCRSRSAPGSAWRSAGCS